MNTEPARSLIHTPDGGLGYALSRAARAWRGEVERALPAGVTSAQFFVLMAIRRAEIRRRVGPTQHDIAERLDMDPNTASQVIRSLEHHRLLARSAHPRDGRAWTLTLTDSGRATAVDCSRRVRSVNANFFGILNPDFARQLADLLATLTDAAEERR